jgi:hypothetical protein
VGLGTDFKSLFRAVELHDSRREVEAVSDRPTVAHIPVMSDAIEPVLSAKEWDDARNRVSELELRAARGQLESVIALANDELDDNDTRKITRKRIAMLRAAADIVDRESVTPSDDPLAIGLEQWADALESYLPPEA